MRLFIFTPYVAQTPKYNRCIVSICWYIILVINNLANEKASIDENLRIFIPLAFFFEYILWYLRAKSELENVQLKVESALKISCL